MGINQTEQIKILILTGPNRLYEGIGQTEILALTRPNRPISGCWPERRDRNLVINQTEQTKIWVGTRPNRHRNEY